MKRPTRLAALALLLAAGAAQAHTGHGTATAFEGLAHPLGWDHLLAMVAVGLWSARALPAGRRALGPLAFMAALAAGAAAGAAGWGGPLVEPGVALSVALFGAMLLLARRLPLAAGLVATAAAAAVHGLAHGAELPAGGGFAAYAAGFLATTAVLHAAGLGLGGLLRDAGTRTWQALGGTLGLAGLALLVLR
ncbi:MAG: HupE/UreJ family protein [Burkholderiaceae bacterium]